MVQLGHHSMSRQDKATTDKNAKILRELVRQPENKNCADCKRNDARWAAWNLGCFLCIRCSGIHRSMGTHISKVKSIDLDIWTPEQMDNITKWGNHYANLYWEKHLKAGHIPADHKIESFIRSKYETKRWAMDGPPPSDPRVLDGQAAAVTAPQPTATATAPAPTPSSTSRSHPLLGKPKAVPTPAPAPVDLFASDDPPLAAPLSTAATMTKTAAAPAPSATPAPAPAPAPAPSAGLFDLDFRTPTPTTTNKTAKQDIMSLFSTPSAPPSASPYATWNGGVTSSAPPQQQQLHQPQQQHQVPIASFGAMNMDGMGAGVWGQPTTTPAPTQSRAFDSHDVWASPAPAAAPQAPAANDPSKQDPFANIWG